MSFPIFTYPIIIKEVYLDSFGHVNNAVYLTLFEEARWDLITKNGYGLQKIKDSGIGPVILEINLKFMRELRVREEVLIESQTISYHKKTGRLSQRMIRDGEVCCTADVTMALFSLKERKLVMPTPDWMKAIGIENLRAEKS